jgi:RNA polymerase sigma factor (sigma-70 family)
MVDHRTDRELVAAHLSGDRSALAAIYDRYADPLYDTAAAMLADRHEAEDLTHDVFVTASRKLAQLRQPERLRAWLFAVLRNEVYRRSSKRSRVQPVDPAASGMAEMRGSDDSDSVASVEAAELAMFVRDAARGLGERDQLLLELSARQGLAGADLADAMGVSQQQCHVLLHRMRERVQRSIGALTVARYGRSECPELQALLAGWNGVFDELTRKRVAGHVDQCEVCGETSRRWAVLPLFSAAPALAAPIALRDRVLASASSPGGDGGRYRFDSASGFPQAARFARPVVLLVAAAVALLVVLGGTWLAIAGDDDPNTTVDVTSSSSPVSDTLRVSDASLPAASTSASSPTSPPAPPPGQLALSSDVIDLGAELDQDQLLLVNFGGQPIQWELAGDPAPFTTSATRGAIDPGQSRQLWIGIDRDAMAEGDVSVDLQIRIAAGGEGESAFTLLAAVEHPPAISVVRAPSTLACPTPIGQVVVTVTDESAVEPLELSWSGSGEPGAAPMNEERQGWSGRLTPDRVNGPWTWEVTATDARGNVGTATAPFVIANC